VTTVAVAAAALLAAVVKGLLGMGFPPVATPLIATVTGVETAVVSVAIPGFLQNAVQVWGGRAHLRDLRSFAPLIVMLGVGSLIGAYLITALPVHLVTLLVGVAVMIYAGLALLRIEPVLPKRGVAVIGGVTGFAAGVLGGATGIFAPILAVYLAATRPDKYRFTAVIALLLFVGQIPQLIGYAMLGLFTRERLLLAAIMLPPVGAGFALGTLIRSRVSQRAFAVVVRWALLLIGLRLVVEAFL
jgi:uncharacterized membrane protein YfcA